MPRFPVNRAINTAQTIRHPQQGDLNFAVLNCALCTAAALTGKTSGEVNREVFVLSGVNQAPRNGYEPDNTFSRYGAHLRQAANKGLKFADPVRQPDWDENQFQNQRMSARQDNETHAQVKGMKRYVCSVRGGGCEQYGNVQVSVGISDAIRWMATKPSRTEFAFYYGSMGAETQAHWVYAENVGHSVEFVDYQEYLANSPNPPPRKTLPTCLGRKAQSDTQAIVLAFPP